MSSPEEKRSLFRIVRGTPSDAEVVALALVLAAATGSAEDVPHRERDRWSDPSAGVRTALQPGRGAWRTTYRPR